MLKIQKKETTSWHDYNNKIDQFIGKLLPYLDIENSVFVGGIAINYHLKTSIRVFNDIDMVQLNNHTVSPNVTREFMVYHYHKISNSNFLALVDPETGIKIDIFPKTLPIHNICKVKIGKYMLSISGLEDQLVKTILDTQRVLSQNPLPVDPKQFSDAKLMLDIADIKHAEKYWSEISPSNGLVESFNKAHQHALKNSQLVTSRPFRKPKPYNCKECVDTPQFPITPMKSIYEVLGFVE